MLDSTLDSLFSKSIGIPCIVGGLFLIIAEIGYQMGLKKDQSFNKETAVSEIVSYHSVVMGLLALLLGFTFSMALNHFDARRALVLQEENSIGTTWLRTSFLPEGPRNASRKLLKQYLNLRIGEDQQGADLNTSLAHLSTVENELWKQAEAASLAAPNPITATYITSLNETFDLGATRVAMSKVHIPGALWLIILVVSSFGLWASGYNSGLSGRRIIYLTVGLPLLITLVLYLITDLNNPKRGFIRTDYNGMILLRDSMN